MRLVLLDLISSPMDFVVANETMRVQVLRWRPTAPIGLPRASSKDDRFRDYFFPKGTVFIINAWTISRNENYYDHPEDFDPERFVRHPYGLRTSRPSSVAEAEWQTCGCRSLYTFGSGRRICPGEQFAFSTMLVAAAKILWAFDVLPPPGKGVDVNIETGYNTATVTEAIDPSVHLRLRDEKREAGLVEDFLRTAADAREALG